MPWQNPGILPSKLMLDQAIKYPLLRKLEMADPEILKINAGYVLRNKSRRKRTRLPAEVITWLTPHSQAKHRADTDEPMEIDDDLAQLGVNPNEVDERSRRWLLLLIQKLPSRVDAIFLLISRPGILLHRNPLWILMLPELVTSSVDVLLSLTSIWITSLSSPMVAFQNLFR